MRILHALSLLMFRGMARLPFWCLYIIADCIYFMLYHVARYRRKLVMKNLTASFPLKSESELKDICHRFYHNFADYIVETVKLLHISDEEMERRMVFENLESMHEILDSGQSIVAYFSHCFNWEWATSFVLAFHGSKYKDAKFCQIYRPLKDEWMDAVMLRLRSRFHSISIKKSQTLRELLTMRRDGYLSVTGFMSDQKPSHGDPTFVTDFLHQPTAFITGTETLARRLSMAAVYWDMRKVSRGHYTIRVRVIGTDLDSLPPLGVTARYAEMLQETIELQPDIWLWTHNRWKNPVKLPAKDDE